MIRHTKLFFADVQEVIERVGRDAILFRVGALQYQFGEPGFLFPAEMAWTAGPVSIIESVEALGVVARDGIAQRLPIEEARRAHEMLGEGGVLGKLVLLPNG